MSVPAPDRGVDTPAPANELTSDRLAAIPEQLRTGKRFVGWRSERRPGEPTPAKVPHSPDSDDRRKRASTTNPAHWVDFETALTYSHVAGLDGVGRVLVESDGLVGVDLDNCRDPETGQLTERAADFIKRLDTYTEISPSGTGVKAWAYGTLPPHGRHRGDVEMYCSARFFTLTGRHLEGTPLTVGYRPDAVLAIHREIWGETPDPSASDADPDHPVPALQLGDEDVLQVASESPHNGERFRRLWAGDTSDYATDGNGGASEADCALCELLAYYGGPDRERIDRLYRRSGLYREKWERADYRRWTIGRALRGKNRFYLDGARPTPASAGSDGASGCTCPACPDRGEAARLRRLLLDRDDRLESLDATVRVQRERLTELRERLDGWQAVLSNPKLKPADRIVAIPIIEQVRAAQLAEQDEIHVRHPGIVKRWGLPASTVQKSAAVLTDMPGAPLAKRHDNTPVHYVDPETGRPTVATPTKVLYRALADGDLFQVVARYDPGLPQRGGRRHPLEHCPEHPDADLKVRHVKRCAVCARPVGEPTETTLRVQNDALDGAPRPDVVVRTDGRQNDALDERAAAMVQIPLDRDPDRWKRVGSRVPVDFEERRAARRWEQEPPGWLAEWPDTPAAHPPDDAGDIPAVFLQ